MHLAEIVKLERVCRGCRCTVHRGLDGFSWNDPIVTGENLQLHIPSPGEGSHDEAHWKCIQLHMFIPET